MPKYKNSGLISENNKKHKKNKNVPCLAKQTSNYLWAERQTHNPSKLSHSLTTSFCIVPGQVKENYAKVERAELEMG